MGVYRTCPDCGIPISRGTYCRRHAAKHRWENPSRAMTRQLAAARKSRYTRKPCVAIDVSHTREVIRASGLSHNRIERTLGWSSGYLHHALTDRGRLSPQRIDQLACFLGRHSTELVA